MARRYTKRMKQARVRAWVISTVAVHFTTIHFRTRVTANFHRFEVCFHIGVGVFLSCRNRLLQLWSNKLLQVNKSYFMQEWAPYYSHIFLQGKIWAQKSWARRKNWWFASTCSGAGAPTLKTHIEWRYIDKNHI